MADEAQTDPSDLILDLTAPEDLAAMETPEDLPVIEDLTETTLDAAVSVIGASDEPPKGALERYKERRKGKREPTDAKGKGPSTGPPTAKEWQDFLGGSVLRIATELYLMATLFKYIDESELTSRERELVKLTKEDLADIAAPMATVASKNSIARKHGRSVIALADSAESLIDLVIWMRRVNRIAKKYRPKDAKQSDQSDNVRVYEGQVIPNGQVQGPDSTLPGYIPPFSGGRG
jgi:hypothetical protein